MTTVEPRAGILNIRPHMVAACLDDSGREIINICSNENALGPSPRAIAAAETALQTAERYPEGARDRLAEAIGATFRLDPARIVCGHGSDDLLARLARAYLSPGDELIYSVSGYQKIPNYAHANDAVPVGAPDCDLKTDVDAILDRVGKRTRVVMIASPDNPTGLYLPGKEVRRLHAGLPDDVLLVLDSAYAEYVDAPDYEDPVSLIAEAENVVMTRTFSKIFGLAGLRLGWLYGPLEIADVIRRIGITFPVSGPGLAAGVAALADEDYTRQVLATNRTLRKRFTDRLVSLGFRVYPSQTNFVLVPFEDPQKTAIEADAFLTARGIVARRFASAIFSNCMRFTIGREEEMIAAGDALEEFVKGA